MARKSKAPVNMSSLLKSTTGTLAQIKEKTNSLTILANIVKSICPDLPEDSWHVANSRQDKLIIDVKSPAWRQRFQFERDNICNALSQQTGGKYLRIEIKINPQSFRQSRIKVDDMIKNKNVITTEDKTKVATNKVITNEIMAKKFMDIAKNAPKGLKEKLEKLAKVAGAKYL